MLVQTSAPDAAAIAAAARHDADGFLAGELERRRALGYPPFADLIRVVCSSEDGAPARAAAGAVAAAVDGAPAHGGARPRAAVPPARARALPGRRQDRRARRGGARDGRRRRRRRARPRAPRRVASASTSTRNRLPGRMAHEDPIPPRTQEEAEALRDRIDPETRARRDAALKLVRQYGDPVLRSRALEVERFDERARGGGPPDGPGHARRARHRPRRHAGRRDAPRARLPRRPRRAGRRRRQPRARVGQRRARAARGGLPVAAGRARRGRAAGARARPRPGRARRRAADRGLRASRRACSSTRWTTSTAC